MLIYQSITDWAFFDWFTLYTSKSLGLILSIITLLILLMSIYNYNCQYIFTLLILYIYIYIYIFCIYIYIYIYIYKTSDQGWPRPGNVFCTLGWRENPQLWHRVLKPPSLPINSKVKGIELKQVEMVGHIYKFTSKFHSRTTASKERIYIKIVYLY